MYNVKKHSENMKQYIMPAVTITKAETSNIIALSLQVFDEETTEQGTKQEVLFENIWGEEED